MSNLESVTSAKKTLARMADVLGAAPEPVRPKTLQDYLRQLSINAPRDINDGAGTLVGAGLGYYFGGKRRHKWLGAIGGASLGRNLPALLSHDRGLALANMGVTGAALAGSLYMKRHPKTGFVVGWLLGGLITGGLR